MSSYEIMTFEGDINTATGWCQYFGCSPTDIEQLILDAVLVPTGPLLRERAYRLNFVGLVAFAKTAFWVLPKIMRDKREFNFEDALKTTASVIFKFVTRTKKNSIFEYSGAIVYNTGGTFLQVFNRLLSWTADYGFHSKKTEFYSESTTHIDWASTFKNTPIFMRKNLIFSPHISLEYQNIAGKLANIQAFALLEMAKKIGPLISLWLRKGDPILNEATSIIEEMPIDFASLENDIRWVLENSNQDHERELASILLDWLQSNASRTKGPQLMGCNAFHTVWETMCKQVFTIDTAEYQNFAHLPYIESEEKKIALPSLRPDMFFINHQTAIIVDAKWYDWEATNYPSSSDLVKQIMYELTLKKNGINYIKNYFIVPIFDNKSQIKILGTTQFTCDTLDKNLPIVTVIGLQWRKIVEAYTSDKKNNSFTNLIKFNKLQ